MLGLLAGLEIKSHQFSLNTSHALMRPGCFLCHIRFSMADVIFPHCICFFLLGTRVDSVPVQVQTSLPDLLGGYTLLPLTAEERQCVCHKLSPLPSAAACGSN